MTSKILALLVFIAATSVAQAQTYVVGNDTGGMIPWSPENELVAVSMAGGHCAGYGKFAHITSVYRQYGNYIGFACAFPRGYVIREREFAIRTRG